jgi:glycerol-3-phosphate dehydrogenase
MDRQTLLDQIQDSSISWDILVIGGGATGLGIAVDAALRGYKTLLLEQSDFAKGTSSRSTKLIHGGVRYLAQGKIALVFEALKERGLLFQNAAHLVQKQAFVIPVYSWWHALEYLTGLKLYDLLAGKWSLGSSRFVNKTQTIAALPTVKQQGLKGGILYFDSQFDDARLALNLAQTATENGATVLNYFKVTDLIKGDEGKVTGVKATDVETGLTYTIHAKSIINATGVFADQILRMESPQTKKLIQPSQGVHLVLKRSFLPGNAALLIPKTSDNRVLFAVPWQGHLLLGTTDTLLQDTELEPKALQDEIRFILNTAGNYLNPEPQLEDILSVFAGIRPLAAQEGNTQSTKDISRNYKILTSKGNLITITGGKWTIYRKMAEDVIDTVAKKHLLPYRKSRTEHYPIHGNQAPLPESNILSDYGTDALEIEALMNHTPGLRNKLHPDFNYTEALVVWAVRKEFARTVEDVLARRLRLLFLNAEAAIQSAPTVGRLMAAELNKDIDWQEEQVRIFTVLAEGYKVSKSNK